MKQVLAAAVIALLVPWFSSAQAAGRSRTPKGPPKPNVPYDTQAGRFIWNPNDETLSLGTGRDSSVVADSISVNPRVADTKNPKDKGTVYYLEDGLLFAYSPKSSGLSAGERTQKVVSDQISTFETVAVGEYAGIALSTGSKFIAWKAVSHEAIYAGDGVKSYVKNPFFNQKKCGPLGLMKKRYWNFAVFLYMSGSQKVWGADETFKTFELTAASDKDERQDKFDNLDDFMKRAAVGKCTPTGY